jgi:hypothetical protein
VRPGRSPGSLLTTGLSITFAVILWMVAIGKRNFDVVETVPVVPPPLPESLVVLEPVRAQMESITFSGRGTLMLLDQLRGRPASVSLGPATEILQGPWPVAVEYSLSAADIDWDGVPFEGLTVTAFGPPTVQLLVDRSQTVSAPIKIISSGPVPARFFWSDREPGSVDVTGAASVVQSIDSVRTIAVLPGQSVRTAAGFEPIPSVTNFSPAIVEVRLIRPVRIVAFDDL